MVTAMVGRVLGDRYEILEKIGGGGMALVYKARCRMLNRYVAIKVLRPEFTEDEDFIKKFKRESQAAASLSNPNIVAIYDVGTENDTYYIVMEYVKGQTLKELIRSKGSLGVEYATNIALQVCSAIEHAHKNHIVHRDIKSHNILIKEDNSAKVTDFGIARAVSSTTITNTGNIIGSVHYFSPEQARGGYTDEKSDIYSLGVVMYEMITGRLPFEGESPIAVALKHVQEEPVKPSKINPRIPRAIEDIVLKCMEKDISKRYNNATEIINDLRQSLVMPNGDFVKKAKFTDESTRIMEPIKAISENAVTEKLEDSQEDNQSDAEGGKPEKPVKSKVKINKMLVGAIIGGLLLAVAVFAGAAFMMNGLFNVKEVTVPNLVNSTEEEARDKLTKLGLTMDVTERVFNKDIAEGMVINQNPKANDKNKVTNPVKVVISKGPRKVTVPPLVGESYDKVDLILEKEGLVEGKMEQEYSDYPSGVVIRQDVTAGIQVDEGTAVGYVISMGPEKFVMPNYAGSNIEDVKSDLLVKDLELGGVTYESSSQYKDNQVISQSVTAGTEVSRKSRVDFVVCKNTTDPGQNNTPQNKVLKIPLPQNLDSMKVTIYKVQSGTSTRIYEATHKSSDSPLEIAISGEGEVVFEVYINDSLYDSMNYTFK